ncbi:MAG: hypothetical protein Q9223_000962 [Gallowayella weberi]
MSTYRFSSAVTDVELKRWGISTTMDVRNHNQDYLAYEGSQEYLDEVAAVLGGPVRWKACSQKHGHLMALSAPECLPDRLGFVSGLLDMFFLFDGCWFYELCAYGMDLEINETEKEQASRPTRAIIKAIIYVNDFYSWDKEKAEQKAVAANQDMFSAVTVLMKERQISETNALDMVRAKALEWEKEHWAAVADLEAAGPISANLYRYLEMTRFCHTGGMLWSAFTDRYSNMGQTQVGGDSRTPETLSMPKHENTSARQVLALVNDSSSNIET